ncbi:cysteine dioxygenase family protein [Nocardioides zeae]|uniref:Cysteine dioxygenase family protein n=1 Tax=Nocardioides imazamoxiresistens TaxID=3231893 RepID=A0ABU3PS77_9ACTN|nr:cysteine dioxygenase family protein [Nocardioides zeae]MDT9592081.1 cysteine dioxygenase family protein [Nocardioides zeae]
MTLVADDTRQPGHSESGTACRLPVAADAAADLASYPADLTVADLPRRDLDPAELEAVAAAVAQQPETWRHLVGFDSEERVYASLHRDAHVDIWLLCWTPENDTGWHDHDVSSGAVAVVDGELVENNLTLLSGARETSVGAGRVFSFGPDHIHRLNGARAGSVSIHAYSPPLWRMGQYSVDDAGTLRRVSLSYADELRPLD